MGHLDDGFLFFCFHLLTFPACLKEMFVNR
jgi:hypothetical protein